MKINSTPDVPVIYENPKHPLPEWANWMVKFLEGFCTVFEDRPSGVHNQTWSVSGRFGNLVGYDIPGPWQDSLRRIVRLSERTYYAPENPYTDTEGFLPHDGGVMPTHVQGKRLQLLYRDGTKGPSVARNCRWPYTGGRGDIIAYRIVGEQEELRSEKSAESIETRPPSDATYPREAVQRAYEHGYRDGVDNTPGGPPAERRHRNELAARTLTPVPGMDSFMHDVIREARRRGYQELLVLEDVRGPESQITKPALKHLFDMADAMIEQEDSE